MQYPSETSSEVNEQSTALNAIGLTTTPYRPHQVPVQMYATWQPQANLPGWSESEGKGNQPSLSKSRYSVGTSTLQHSSNIEEFIERVDECSSTKRHDRAYVWRSAPLVTSRAPKMAIMARLLWSR